MCYSHYLFHTSTVSYLPVSYTEAEFPPRLSSPERYLLPFRASKPIMRHQWLLVTLFQGSIAWPTLLATREDNKFEWTALGDSYASGVGSTKYIDGRRCLRYDQGYPSLLNNDPDFANKDHVFNNVVCSGAHYNDVENYQFYDEDTFNQPNFQYSISSFVSVHQSSECSRTARSQTKIWQSPDGHPGCWW